MPAVEFGPVGDGHHGRAPPEGFRNVRAAGSMDTTIADQWALFQSSGYKLKGVLKSIFTADDFVKF